MEVFKGIKNKTQIKISLVSYRDIKLLVDFINKSQISSRFKNFS